MNIFSRILLDGGSFVKAFGLSFNMCRRISRSKYQFPELREEDLEEQFVKGSGHGGQAVNRTNNCVLLRHKPTGLYVRVHEDRLVTRNRDIARHLLVEKLDLHLNGENSYLSIRDREEREKKRRYEQQRKIRREKMKEFKEMVKGWKVEESSSDDTNRT